MFLFKKYFFQKILPNLVEKAKQIYVLPKLIDYISTTTSFDSWMSKGVHNIFALVINFLGYDWQPKQVTIGLFEATKITMQALANNLTKLFDQYGLRNKIIAFVKDEGSNLNTMTIALNFVIKCEVLGLYESFRVLVLAMFFPKHANMLLLTKKSARISSLFQSNLPNQICKNV